jgi:hypothetical protein
MLDRLAEGNGMELTATKNLNRRFVGEMLDAFDWPGYDVDLIRSVSKVVNEPDFPLSRLCSRRRSKQLNQG